MNLGISTLFVLSRPFEEAIREIESFDICYVEIVDDGVHALHPSRVRLLNEKKATNNWQYSVHAPFADVNIACHDPSLRRAITSRLENSIRYASQIDATIWVFHPGASTALEPFYPGKSWSLNLESVRHLSRIASDFGVKAAIENVPEPFPFLLKSVEDFERFYDELREELSMVLDIAHANIKGESLRFIEHLGSRIAHIHASDNLADQDTHMQIGKGTVRWTEIVKHLRTIDFKGCIMVESKEGAQESLTYLRKLIG